MNLVLKNLILFSQRYVYLILSILLIKKKYTHNIRDVRMTHLTVFRTKSVNVNFVYPEDDVASFDLKKSDIDHFRVDNIYRSTIYLILITLIVLLATLQMNRVGADSVCN